MRASFRPNRQYSADLENQKVFVATPHSNGFTTLVTELTAEMGHSLEKATNGGILAVSECLDSGASA
jgi:hypothetical protein